MLDAIGEIRGGLDAENRSRTRRSVLLLFALAFAAAAMPLRKGVPEAIGPQELLSLAVAASFVLLGISMSASHQVRLGPVTAVLVASLAFLSPLIAATSLGGEVTGWRCFTTIAGLGLAALVAARWILGRSRRRFGGASELQAVACAMAPALGVGLECPASDAVHLLVHTAAAVLVGAVLSRALLR